MTHCVIYTDLDGTLLDANTYSWEAARPALELIRSRDDSLVLCSSKTRAEILDIRKALENGHPFISENGGAIFIPEGYFPSPFRKDRTADGLHVIERGTAYHRLRADLKAISKETGVELTGYGDLSEGDISSLTGLSLDEAKRSRLREYDEPFLIRGDESDTKRVLAAIEGRGLRWTRGGRFHHLTGENDKGKAARILTSIYSSQYQEVITIGLGDGYNDLPMLAAVDYPVLVEKEGGGHESSVQVPGMTRAAGIGPIGWNNALIELLNRFSREFSS